MFNMSVLTAAASIQQMNGALSSAYVVRHTPEHGVGKARAKARKANKAARAARRNNR